MRVVGVVVVPGLQLMSLAALAVFQAANVLKERRVYEVRLLSEKGGNVTTAAGFPVGTVPLAPDAYDTLLVAASVDMAPSSVTLVDFLVRTSTATRRVGSLCTGAFALAQAGLLTRRRVTTHWRHARALQARFPDLQIETDRLFINDGPVWTSAGMMAGVDMTLALVEADLGSDVARTIARRMVLERRRRGGHPQASNLLDLEPRTGRVQRVLDHIRTNLRHDLSVARLSDVANLSPRQLSRAFARELGEPPAKVVERLRAEAARALLIERGQASELIADQVGFATRERMRRTLVRLYGKSPKAFREGASPADPSSKGAQRNGHAG
jgi:transcriptional regulator GlxA family with amidase domain